MKLRPILIFILALFTSCDKENIELDDFPTELHTDERITVTNINLDSSASYSPKGTFNLLGHGYDVIGQFADPSAARHQIIDVVKLKQDEPYSVELANTNTMSSLTIASKNCESYSNTISLRANTTEESKLFKGAITSYFPDQGSLSDKYIYSSYTLKLQKKRIYMMPDLDMLQKYVTDAFRADIQNRTPQKIVEKYGTHILTDIQVGAKLVVLYQAETVNKDREEAAELGLTVAMNNVFKLFTGSSDYMEASKATGNFSQKLNYKTSGGDIYKITQSPSTEAKYPTVDISKWSQSLTDTNVELIDFNFSTADALLPIYEVIEDPVKKEKVKKYIQTYLAENQICL